MSPTATSAQTPPPGTSTGPRTPEGKKHSAFNAYKHGLTGQTLILTAEEQVLYDEHCQSYHDLYKPSGHPEKILVQTIADDYWRALRGRSLESARFRLTFDGELDGSSRILAPSNVWLHNEKALANLTLYIQRIERSIKNNTQALAEMQALRKQSEKDAKEKQTQPPAHAVASHSSRAPRLGEPSIHPPQFVFSTPSEPAAPASSPRASRLGENSAPPASSPRASRLGEDSAAPANSPRASRLSENSSAPVNCLRASGLGESRSALGYRAQHPAFASPGPPTAVK